jgi:pimeloyl-ACP methyl ester carboxylesterase
MATFLLVHGAWHGGWSWRRTARRLREAGHEVFTPSLTGLGDRSHLLGPGVTLSTHVRDVTNLIEHEELRDVVLCGHSYSGLVVAQAADQMPGRIAALVFLDAFLPEDGKALLDLLPPESRAASEAEAREQGDGWFLPAPAPERLELADAADRHWFKERSGAQPLATFTEPSRLIGAWRTVPRLVYIAATHFTPPVFQRFAQAVQADPAFEYYEVPCGHEIMIDRPDALHAILTGDLSA